MAKTLIIKDPKQIPVILDLIHDRWFNSDDINFDPKESVLAIKFGCEAPGDERGMSKSWLLKKLRRPIFECVLRIHNVKSYWVDDKAQVGTYDFNDLSYDPAQKRFSISTGVPIEIDATVEDFQVSLDQTDRAINGAD